MADVTGSGFMGDATGGIGQGLAFVLPEGKAPTYAMQLAQTHAAQLTELAKQKNLQTLKAQNQYEQDFKEQKLPEAFAPFDKQISDRQNKWLEDAAKSYATTGKNPFNDPEFMARHNTEVLVPARQSKELGQNYTKLRAIAETDPSNKYTKESKKSVIDFEEKMKADPMSVLDKPLPQLVENPATVDDLVKALKPTTDPSNNKAQVFSAIAGDPKWQNILKGYGYNSDLPDFGVYTDPAHPNGKRVWYTNPAFTGHQADLILDAPDDSRNKAILDKIGIHPGDQYAREKLQHAISDQNAAMGKAVSEIGSRMDNMIDPEKQQQITDQKLHNRVELHNMHNADERLNIEEQRLKMAKDKQHADNIAENVYNFNTNPDEAKKSLETISKMYQTSGAYKAPLKNIHIDGNTLSFTIPARKKANPQYSTYIPVSAVNQPYINSQPEIPVNVPLNNLEQIKAVINGALKNVGGESNYNKYIGSKGSEQVKPIIDKNKIKNIPKLY